MSGIIINVTSDQSADDKHMTVVLQYAPQVASEGGREGGLLKTGGSIARDYSIRRKGDCRRIPKQSRRDVMSRDAIERMHGGSGVGEKNEALYQREVAVGGGNVRPRYMEAYVSVHRPHIKVGMRRRIRGSTMI